MYDGRVTLTHFLVKEERSREDARTEGLTALLIDLATACKAISNTVARALLARTDPELPQQIEAAANDVMIRSHRATGNVAGMASEAAEEPVLLQRPRGKLLLVFDPLNGSENLDINFVTGTIFSVLRAPAVDRELEAEDFLQPGTEQIAAGFCQYGASTRLFLTTGNGVNGFTLDRDVGEFTLTHPGIAIPADASTFAINTSNERFWEPPVRRYVEECLAGNEGPRGRDFGMRWVASLVAEAHRLLTRGGVFLYPFDERTREQGGRLSLLHEANPISFLIEQAGGASTTGRRRVLEVVPTSLRQHVPFIFGSKNEVERLIRYHREYIEGREPERSDSPLFSSRSLFRLP